MTEPEAPPPRKYSPLVLSMRSRNRAQDQAAWIRKMIIPDVRWLDAANRTHDRADRADLAADAVQKLEEAAALLDQVAALRNPEAPCPSSGP